MITINLSQKIRIRLYADDTRFYFNVAGFHQTPDILPLMPV